ncbi:M15 family metallopeptidase [Acinetobacter pollinis]|uniref:D-alanyl-D-alanine dipeptidase n=1 Tax=Acinetobacter pollinis TaxID=2605270 RepID=A0ABU6DQR3_9GAMM|nr:M15 family metallopeptidase [Acinetobacter pollinis]MEB5475748.1 M15 family metallopeptidase [Acinetobacter pollinis]
MYYKSIPKHPHIHWDDMFQTNINSCNERLVSTDILRSHRILTHSAYFLAGIRGALPTCYVRASLIEKLIQVGKSLPPNIYLMILDGWRPVEVQTCLRESFYLKIQEKYKHLSISEQQEILNQFVALPNENPNRPSPHLTGGSVDVTLCDKDGNILDMGTAFDEIHALSFTDALEGMQEYQVACKHRRILYWAMTSAGFTNLPSEWWHFDYGNQLWAYTTKQQSAHYGIASLSSK